MSKTPLNISRWYAHPIVTQYEEEQTYKLLTDSELKKGLETRINRMAELKGDIQPRHMVPRDERTERLLTG